MRPSGRRRSHRLVDGPSRRTWRLPPPRAPLRGGPARGAGPRGRQQAPVVNAGGPPADGPHGRGWRPAGGVEAAATLGTGERRQHARRRRAPPPGAPCRPSAPLSPAPAGRERPCRRVRGDALGAGPNHRNLRASATAHSYRPAR